MTVLDTFSLSGQVAVVTGGNRGLGRAFAHALGEAGASIAILARDVDKNAEVVAELADKGISASAFEGDVASHANVDRAAGEIVSAYEKVDVLINNAGTCIHRPALDVTQEEWNQVIDVNLTGVWNGCQVFGKRMIDAGGGVIVNVGSISGQIVNRPQWQPAYNASKAGVNSLTKTTALEFAADGIRVNAVLPGGVLTAGAKAAGANIELKGPIMGPGRIPLGKMGEPEDIAMAALFFASPASRLITGQLLAVDGGFQVS